MTYRKMTAQVKHCVSGYPFNLENREVVSLTVYETTSISYLIYRIEFGDEVGECYLDLITDTDGKYITFGGSNQDPNFLPTVAEQICESASLIQRLQTAQHIGDNRDRRG